MNGRKESDDVGEGGHLCMPLRRMEQSKFDVPFGLWHALGSIRRRLREEGCTNRPMTSKAQPLMPELFLWELPCEVVERDAMQYVKTPTFMMQANSRSEPHGDMRMRARMTTYVFQVKYKEKKKKKPTTRYMAYLEAART